MFWETAISTHFCWKTKKKKIDEEVVVTYNND